jgi:transglutaminase/protease-like cytokinesis protein 3
MRALGVVLVCAGSVLAACRTGFCQSYALLFVALARAAGIAARQAGGWVWAGSRAGGFAAHAWAEVDLDGRWQAVDPTWGQTVADATHIDLWPCDLEIAVVEVVRGAGTAARRSDR